MDREELIAAIELGPVTIRMNDGAEYAISNPREAIVSSLAAHVLYRGDDQQVRAAILPLVTMAAVLPVEA